MQKETGRLTVGNSRYESRSYDKVTDTLSRVSCPPWRRHEERRKKRRDVVQKETGHLTVGNSRYESRSYDIRLLVVLKKQFCV